jgi:6-pyruvoyltetrahydropterin 2'-reductase
MGLPHLTNEKAMKNYFGPQSGIGDKSIYLAEKPFITIQGEGPNAGKNTLFVRFFGCNLANSCGVDWCDSTHSFYTDKELKRDQETGLATQYPFKEDRLTFPNVDKFCETIFEIDGLARFNNVVFTGGEPMLWQMSIARILQYLKNTYTRDITVEIETNGTVPVEPELSDWFRMVHFNISPKLHVVKKFPLVEQLNSGEFDHNGWIVKFVHEGEESEDNITLFLKKQKIDDHKVYIMPEGITRDIQMKKMQKIAEWCITNGYNFSPRLHVLIWDQSKGI